MANTDTAKSTFLLDGQQAVNEMDKLIQKSKELKEARDKAAAANDLAGFKAADAELRANEKTLRSYKKAVFDTDAVLKNLNGSTLKDLEQAARTIGERMKVMTRGTEEWKKSSSDLSKLKGEISGVKAEMNGAGESTGVFANLWKSVGIVAGAASGILASAYGVIEVGKQAIASSQTISDRWKVTTAGLSGAWGEFLNSLATWDWDKFLSRLGEAAKASRDYAEVIDLLEKRQAGLSTRHKQEDEEIAKLRLSYYDHNKTAKEKAAIMEQAIQLTQKQSEEDAAAAKENYDAYTQTILQAKGIAAADMEAYLKFEATTEKKTQLVQRYNDLEKAQQSNFLQLTGDAYQEYLNMKVQGVGAVARIENKLSDEQIKKARDLYDAVSMANKAKYENKEGLFRKMEMQEKKDEKLTAAAKTSVELLEAKIKELSDTQLVYIQTGDKRLDQVTKELVANKLLLESYKKIQEALNMGIELNSREMIQYATAKGTKGIKSEGVKLSEKDKNALNVLTTGSESRDKTLEGLIGMSDERRKAQEDAAQQWVDTEYAMADNLNTSLTNMVIANQQAQLEHKLSSLEIAKEKELSNKNLTEKQKAAIELKYDKQIRAAKQEQWKKQRDADAISTTIATILAVMKAGGPLTPQGALTAMAGALSVGEILAQDVPEFGKGRYSVTGQSGRRYNADYAGPAVTGLYTSPAIVAEQGSEMIIDHPTTRNLQLNFPGVLEAINAARVPQFASGRYPTVSTTSTGVALQDGGFVSAVDRFSMAVNSLAQYGIKAHVSLYDLENIQDKRNNLEASVNM